MDDDIEIPARAAGIRADQPGLARLGDRALQPLGLAEEFAPDIDEGNMRPHREAGQQRPFDQFMRIVA